MSTFWTPDGERPVGATQQPSTSEEQPSNPGAAQGAEEPSDEMKEQMEQLRRQLAETPAALVVANHCFGLFELAALHLSDQPPRLGEAQLAIDALAALVENLTGRLGEPEAQLREGLNQLRVAFVQIRQGTTQQGSN